MRDTAATRTTVRKVWGYFRDERVARWRKLTGLFAVLYVLSPVDAWPDFLPVVGWLDDVGVAAAAVALLRRDIERWQPGGDGFPVRVAEAPGSSRGGERQRVA
jgi:uncharacterized membrane protein YkvA (DUF1232 family)